MAKPPPPFETVQVPTLVVHGAESDVVPAVVVDVLREGIARVDEAFSDDAACPVTAVVAGVDERLNELGYIVPGLGDAGDRLYGVV